MADVDILLIEDNDGDIRLVERAFKTRELPGRLHAVQAGDKALDWLYQRGEFAGKPRPDLVLLDLNLPATTGEEILEELKADSELKRIPVIVLTSSQSDDDLVEAYDKCATACLRKPVDPEDFADVIQTVTEFWVSSAVLPPPPQDGETRQRELEDD